MNKDEELRKYIFDLVCSAKKDVIMPVPIETVVETIKLIMNKTEWVSVEDRLPEYGDPVIIEIKGVVQKVTYMRDGCDDTPDWFEPYFFEHDDNTKCWWNDVTRWMLLPESPRPPNDKEKVTSEKDYL